MRMPMAVCVLFLLVGVNAPAQAQAFPVKPFRIVVPTEPGGSSDTLARFLGAKLQEQWGQPVIVENRAGANQMIGADVVVKAPADGHAILLPTITYTTGAATMPKLPFDPLNDLTGITMIGDGPFMVVVHPSLPVTSIKELIALARARPGQINYGSTSLGIARFNVEIFMAMSKTKMTHIPYKSAHPSVIAAVGGHVSVLIISLPSVLSQVKAGRLRALAVTSTQRSAFVPELPTVAEAGVPGYEARQWWGLLAPGKTPPVVINKLNAEFQRTLGLEDVKTRLAHEGAQPVLGMTPEEFNAIVRSDTEKWRKVVRDLKLDMH
jgi:tripartite-type tricarboxylate transporter receptor subunit TctC